MLGDWLQRKSRFMTQAQWSIAENPIAGDTLRTGDLYFYLGGAPQPLREPVFRTSFGYANAGSLARSPQRQRSPQRLLQPARSTNGASGKTARLPRSIRGDWKARAEAFRTGTSATRRSLPAVRRRPGPRSQPSGRWTAWYAQRSAKTRTMQSVGESPHKPAPSRPAGAELDSSVAGASSDSASTTSMRPAPVARPWNSPVVAEAAD